MKSGAASFIFALFAESCIIYASVLVKISSVSPINLAFYRIFLALFPFLALAFLRGQMKNIAPKDMGLMCLAGVFFGFDLLFFNIALLNTTVANVNLIASLACFVLVPIGIIFFSEKMRKQFVIGGLIAFIGVVMLMGGRGEFSVATTYGDVMAFLSMLCYSLFLALSFSLRKKYGALCIMSFVCIGSGVTLGVFAGAIEGFMIPQNLREWGIVLLIAFFGQLLGQGFFSHILARLGTQTSSIVLLCSPAIAAIMGFMILGERLGIFEICGIVIIICGVYITKRH